MSQIYPEWRGLVALAALACCAAGCVIGFDDHKLIGGAGGNDGGSSTPAGGKGDSAGDAAPAAGTIPPCEDFTSYAAGASLPNWVEGNGSWRVVDRPPHGLGQMTTSAQQHELFVGWYSATQWTDQTVTAIVDPDDSWADNCVLARTTDSQNFYQLCIQTRNHNQQQSVASWSVFKMVNGVETRLQGGGIQQNGSHTLSLSVHGTTLTASVDGTAQPDLTDASLDHGAAGLATESTGLFVRLCAVPM